VFDLDPEGHWVELRVHVRGGQILVGTATADDHRTALDRAEEKLKKQLDKITSQWRSRRSTTNP
jgi:ribosome-associated translation inhibitor RaiA